MPRFRRFHPLHNIAKALSLRRRTLVTAALVLLVVSAGVLWVTARVTEASSLAALLNRGEQDLQLYIANIRRELDRYEYLPKVLVHDERVTTVLEHPDKAAAQDNLNRYLAFVANSSGASDIYLMNASGVTLAASNWNQPDSFIGDDYSFRPYFQQAIKRRARALLCPGYGLGPAGLLFCLSGPGKWPGHWRHGGQGGAGLPGRRNAAAATMNFWSPTPTA